MNFDFSRQPGLKPWNGGLATTGTPLVSVITPYYNSGRHIRQTCQSLLNQTFPWFEWIIVNDGSTEETAAATLAELAQLDRRIRIFHRENGGPSAARNFAVAQARTELILPLDADDLLEPTFLEYCWWMLEKNPEAAWAYTNSLGFGGQEYLWSVVFDPERLKKQNHLTVTALIRKEALLSVGGYSQEQKLCNEDWELWLKLVARGCYPAQSAGEEHLFWYRRGDSGVLSQVQTDPSIAKANRQFIAMAAEKVKHPAPPVVYPRPFNGNWASPRLSDWDKCVYQNKTKTHIVFLFPHLVMGGADKFNLDLIAGLDREEFDVSILTTIQSPNGWLQSFRELTPNIFNLPNFVEPEDYAEFISYYLKSRQADILFLSNSYHGYYLLPWLRQHFPQLAIVDYVHMEEWYWRRGGYARTSAMLGAVTEKTYVCNSATRDVLLQHFDRTPESVETAYIGVDEEYFSRDAAKPGVLHKALNLPAHRPIVLFICRLHPQKRPFMMLEIAKKLTAQLPEAAFAVVGDGPQEAELRQAAKAGGLENHVFFLGSRSDTRECYRDARATLVCSLKEGLSLTAYESCAMGVPVVSADVGGQRDLVDAAVGALIPFRQSEADDFDARTFPAEEVDDYVQALYALLTDNALWEETSRNARARIEERFTIGSMVEYFTREFRQLLTDPHRREARSALSQTLAQLGPMAGELFTMEMQMQTAESVSVPPARPGLVIRGLRYLRREGFIAFVGGVFRYLFG